METHNGNQSAATARLKFSIITVCRNNGKTIGRTLESVSTQNYPHYEHIIVDGLSHDDTPAVVEKWKRAAISFRSEQDSGIYDAMNKGIARASGDLICFLNADDYYQTEHVLSEVAAAFQLHNVDAVYGDVVHFHEAAPERVVRYYNSGRFKPSRIAMGLMPAHPATFVRKSVFETFGNFKTDYKIAADFEFFARIFKDNKLRTFYISKSLVRMQIGGVSTRGWRSVWLLNQEILRALQENGIPSSPWKLAKKIPFKLSELVLRRQPQ